MDYKVQLKCAYLAETEFGELVELQPFTFVEKHGYFVRVKCLKVDGSSTLQSSLSEHSMGTASLLENCGHVQCQDLRSHTVGLLSLLPFAILGEVVPITMHVPYPAETVSWGATLTSISTIV